MRPDRLLLAVSLFSKSSAGGAGVTRRATVALAAGFILGLILDLAIAGLLQVSIHRSNQANRRADAAVASSAASAAAAAAARQAAYQSCLAANKVKEADLKRWNSLLALVESRPQTPAMIKFRMQVSSINAAADKLAVCTP